jgi:hypothetical protein
MRVPQLILPTLAALALPAAVAAGDVSIRYAASADPGPLAGRLLLIVATDASGEPRDQVSWGLSTAQVFGADVAAWTPGEAKRAGEDGFFGYPKGCHPCQVCRSR